MKKHLKIQLIHLEKQNLIRNLHWYYKPFTGINPSLVYKFIFLDSKKI